MNPDGLSTPTALVAILRGIEPSRVVDVASILYEEGIRTIEVPLNSPDPFRSIETLAHMPYQDLLVGAGTVLSTEDVRRTRDAGGRLIVAPNCAPAVIRQSVQYALQVMPGVATATEVFTAIDAGASRLKLFPAATYGPGHLKALGAVLPQNVKVFPVGGISAADIPAWLAAGAAGFGFGSEIFRPTYALAEIAARARAIVQALLTAQIT